MRFSVLILIFGLAISSFAYGKGGKSKDCVKTLGALSVDFLRDNVFSSPGNESQRERIRTAVQVSGFKKVAVNLQISTQHTPNYSNTLETSNISDQKLSGRCWSFAACKTLRDSLVRDKLVTPEFEFSTTHQHFFNMLEKSNSYLNKVIKIAVKERVDKSQAYSRNLLNPAKIISDGGWFEFFGLIVQKYGLVPKQVMPETISSENTAVLLEELRIHAAGIAQKILDEADRLRGANAKVAARHMERLHQIREKGILEIVEILRTHLGTPPGIAGKPNTFQWRDKENNFTEYTPQKFAKDFAKFDPKDFVAISNFDSRPTNTLLEIKDSSIDAGDKSFNVKMLNTTFERMLQLTMDSIDQKRSVWFAAAMGKDVDMDTGIMAPGIFASQETYGFAGTKSAELSRLQRTEFSVLALNHAMTMDAYDRPDKNLPPIKIRVSNSWGKGSGDKKVGDQGTFHMYIPWYEQNVFTIVIHKSLLSPEELALWEGPSTKIKMDDLY